MRRADKIEYAQDGSLPMLVDADAECGVPLECCQGTKSCK